MLRFALLPFYSGSKLVNVSNASFMHTPRQSCPPPRVLAAKLHFFVVPQKVRWRPLINLTCLIGILEMLRVFPVSSVVSRPLAHRPTVFAMRRRRRLSRARQPPHRALCRFAEL